MPVRSTRSRLLALPLALALATGFAACRNPAGEDHADHPVALAISDQQGQPVATVSVGQTVTGELSGTVGTARTYTVVALSEDGDVLQLDGGELALRITAQPTQASVVVQGVNQLVVTGRVAGSGTVRIELMHDKHPELGASVPVVVR